MKTLTDKQLRQAWSHMSTEKIKLMGFISGPGEDVDRVNAGRIRILAMRAEEEAAQPASPIPRYGEREAGGVNQKASQ